MNFNIPFMWFLLMPSPEHVQLRNCSASRVGSVIAVGLGSQFTLSRMYSESKPGRDARYVVIFSLTMSLPCVLLFFDMMSGGLSSVYASRRRFDCSSAVVFEFVVSVIVPAVGVL